MDLLSSAELLASLDRSGVALDQKRCLHSICKHATCEACYNVCPTQAIEPGKPPSLNLEACVHCLACLPVCPDGAFQADDSAPALLDCLARLDTQQVELVCQQHTGADLAVPGANAALRVHGCLAGIGVGGYLVMAAMGVEKMTARLDACAACPWSMLQPQVEAQLQTAQRILESCQRPDVLAVIHQPPSGGDSQRPLWDAHNPPLSRRDFFRMANRQSQLATARLLKQKEGHPSAAQPSKDRRRIVAALRHMQTPGGNFAIEGLGFGMITVNAACNACGVCATVCPTAALAFERDGEASFELRFVPSNCTACGLCLEMCAPGAMALDAASSSEAIFEPAEPLLLQHGPLARCQSCSTLMAVRADSKLCLVCDFRRKNPLGSAMPPGYKKRS